MTLGAILNDKVTWALGGALVSVVVAYFAFTRDVLKDINFLKGQNSLILHRVNVVEKLQEKLAALDHAHQKTRYDLDNAFEKLRSMDKRSIHGAVSSHHD